MPIQNDENIVALDFYQGDVTKINSLINNKAATKGHVYLDTTNNNVYIGTSDKVAKAANGVYKKEENVIVDGTSLQLGNTKITAEQLAKMVAVASLDLSKGVY